MAERISIMIDEEKLHARIQEMADEISREYAGEEIHLVTVLKGGVFITTELAKRISIPVTMDFIAVSSYGRGTTSSGKLTFRKDLDESIMGKNVLIVEDIIDSGNTLSILKKLFEEREPKSLRILTLLDKPSRRTVKELKVDYCGFQIPDVFVVGYGLDYAEKYRNLPYIGELEFV